MGGSAPVRGRRRLTTAGRLLAAVALLAACGPRAPERTYAFPAGTAMALEVDVREELLGTKTARRLEVATRGAFQADGSLRLEVWRARLETRTGGGATNVVATDDAPDVRARRTPDDVANARLLESLHGATVRIGFDAAAGVASVEGIDRALRSAPDAEAQDGLGSTCSDDRWRRDLAAAGLCAVPRAVREGGDVERTARIRVPGRGETTIHLAGTVGRDDGGMSAVRVEGRLSADAVFEGERGAEPPESVGSVAVAGVEAQATTTYPPDGGAPVKGQISTTFPYAGGATQRTTTTFTLVRL